MKISKNSILTFFNVNGSLLSISLTKYSILYYFTDVSIFNKFIIMYSIYVIRNYFMMYLLIKATYNKQYINNDTINNNSIYSFKSHLYVFSTTFFDTMINVFLYNKLIHNMFTLSNIINSIIWFIPVSLVFEIILDFFHYWGHRILHLNRTLYKFTHKTHHMYINPVPINAYYFNPIDVIITLSIPMILTVSILPFNLSLFDFIMISVYKQYTELAGHSGKKLSPSSSFPQCIWIPRLLEIELYAENHYMHHKLSKCNFAKRFSFWDKIFGTYMSKDKSTAYTY
jgi:lathosterol oxidase